MFTEETPALPPPSREPVESAGLFAISCAMLEDVPPERLYKNGENIPHPEACIPACRDVSVRRLRLMPLHIKIGKNSEKASTLKP
jgi:hypothetical protein